MAKQFEAIQAKEYLRPDEIADYLEGVEYIIMAQPSTRENAQGPIHFTIFLNTPDPLPQEILPAVLNKFAQQYSMQDIRELLHAPARVAFAQTGHETHMPVHLFTAEARSQLPSVGMIVLDFEADSDAFPEVKEKQLTGWTYAYNE